MLLPHEHTVMVKQTSKWGQIFLMSLVGLGATAFATAWFYRIDEVVTVQGRLVPQKGGVEVKSPLGQKLSKVLVTNGEKVEQGQPLLRFDVKSARSKESTLVRQLTLESERISDQERLNKQRQKTLTRNIGLTEKILEKLRPLEQSGAISEIQILQQSNQLEIQRDELIQLKTKREEIQNNSQSRRVNLEGELEIVRNQLQNEIIRAPISGTVFELKPDNDNYVAVNAEPLLKIVPEGLLSAEVNVSNQDIGFIRPEQPCKIRVDSFPYTEYGEINGAIRNIAQTHCHQTRLRSYHPRRIEPNRSSLKTRDGATIPLQAGMTVTSNLKLRDRRLIELLSWTAAKA